MTYAADLRGSCTEWLLPWQSPLSPERAMGVEGRRLPELKRYRAFWASRSETDRTDFASEALAIASAEGFEMLSADGWVFADRAKGQTDEALAVTGIGLAAARFDQAETL